MAQLFHQEIIEAADSLGIQIVDLSSSQELRAKILTAFNVENDDMLETKLGSIEKSKHDPQGWNQLSRIHIKGPFFLFFNKHQDLSIFEVASLNQISQIMGECTGMTFFVVDSKLKSLIGFDDSDVLFMTGDTAKWPF